MAGVWQQAPAGGPIGSSHRTAHRQQHAYVWQPTGASHGTETTKNIFINRTKNYLKM